MITTNQVISGRWVCDATVRLFPGRRHVEYTGPVRFYGGQFWILYQNSPLEVTNDHANNWAEKVACECADKGCPAHRDRHNCPGNATCTLWRCDMDDVTGTDFCELCAADAMESGLFTDCNPADWQTAD